MNLSNSSQANETLRITSGPPAHTRIILWSILLVWSLLGNVLVIAVVYCNQNLRTNMNLLIVNMAVSDMIIPLIAMPWMISNETLRPYEWLVDGPLGDALCKLVHFLSEMSPFVSTINLVIIAFQRFIVVVYPHQRNILTSKKRWILISIPWILAMALFSQAFYTFRLTKKWGYTMCDYSWSPAFDYFTAHMTFIFVTLIVCFIIPLFVIIISYTIIQYKLRKSLNSVIELIERATIRLRQRINTRLFSMSITVILMLVMGWSPLFVLNLLSLFKHPSITSMNNDGTLAKMRFAIPYMWYLQAAINPCIYFLFLRDFRRGLKRLCCRETVSENGQTSTLRVFCVSTVAPGRVSERSQRNDTTSTDITTRL